jgi:acyl-CoA synthetase (AMP-forming)/AMP-acid ligase II
MKDLVKNKKDGKLAMGDTLYRSLVRWATVQPEQTYIVEAETGREMTYAQTLTSVKALWQLLGSTPCTLMVALPGGIVDAVLWISTITGGHLLIPLSPEATNEEKAAAAKQHAPDILAVEQMGDALSFACPSAMVITKQQCEALIKRTSLADLVEPREGRACLTTSGTTGEPKGVLLDERQIAWTADNVRRSHLLSSWDRGLTVLPFFHVNAPVVSLFASLLAGSTVVIATRFSRRNFWSWVERYRITWVSIVPTIVAMLLETEKPSFLPGSLRFVRTGSASLPATDLRAFEERFGIPVIETYGLSEAASQVTANPVPPGRHKAGSAGRPVGVSLRICVLSTGKNEKLRDVRRGETGEICISGPGVIHAYRNNAGKEAFQEGWFRTGDLGYLDEDGYLFIKGRSREVINRGGENIAPREIEEVLLSSPLIREAAVVGRPDSIYGEQVVAYIVAHGKWSEAMVQDLCQYAAQRLSHYKVPVDFIVLDTLPKNATGKIERHSLRAREQARFATQAVESSAQAS